ncbi:MAG: FAD-dependent oxidoreductase [Sneathiella sp.]
MSQKTDVLIIGGGFGGVGVAQKLVKKGVDVTLVDRKNYFEVTFAALRNVTSPQKHGNTLRKLYSDFIDGTFIQAGVVSMTDSEVRLDTGEIIKFKQAIISSGSRYPTLPVAKSNSKFDYVERNQEMLNAHETLASARSVLVIGGGVVGVEFAGEISSAFPGKDITLVHSGDRLLGNSEPKTQRKAYEQLIDKGIQIKLNRNFAKNDDVYRCSTSGETIKADIVYECVGMLPNTEFLRPELAEILDGSGFVKVDEFMRVKGHDNLYSLGDCADLDSHKHGYLASVQGGYLAKMLIKTMKGKKVKPYKTPPLVVITPTGTNSGVAELPFAVTTLNLFVNLKQKDLGISNMYKTYGTVPDALN